MPQPSRNVSEMATVVNELFIGTTTGTTSTLSHEEITATSIAENPSLPPESNPLHNRSTPTSVAVPSSRNTLKRGKSIDLSDTEAVMLHRGVAVHKSHIDPHGQKTKAFCSADNAFNCNTEFVLVTDAKSIHDRY